MAPAGTHTHTAPPRPVTKAPPARLGARGVCLGHDTDSRVTQCGRPYLFALKSPAPWTVLAVIMAVNRQRAVAIWAGPGPQVLRGTIPRENAQKTTGCGGGAFIACCSNSGSLAKFAAIRRASSFVSSLAAERRPGSSSK